MRKRNSKEVKPKTSGRIHKNLASYIFGIYFLLIYSTYGSSFKNVTGKVRTGFALMGM